MTKRLKYNDTPMEPIPWESVKPKPDPKAYLPPKWMGNSDIPEQVKEAARRQLRMRGQQVHR